MVRMVTIGGRCAAAASRGRKNAWSAIRIHTYVLVRRTIQHRITHHRHTPNMHPRGRISKPDDLIARNYGAFARRADRCALRCCDSGSERQAVGHQSHFAAQSG